MGPAVPHVRCVPLPSSSSPALEKLPEIPVPNNSLVGCRYCLKAGKRLHSAQPIGSWLLLHPSSPLRASLARL